MAKKLITLVLIAVLTLSGCSSTKPAKLNTTPIPDKYTGESKEMEASDNSISDTALWFNGTYAILTKRNGADITLIGGYEASDSTTQMIQERLENSWDVTDKASADSTLNWLTQENGHNAELLDIYNQNDLSTYTREELVDALADDSYSDLDRAYFLGIYDAVEQYGDNAIKSWDLSRAMMLSAWYYLAGYYTYEEAMDASLAIAKDLQNSYTSWDDMIQSYLYGYQYWNEDDITDESSESYTRSQIYQELKRQINSPYSLDWNFSLTKDW